MAMVAVGGSHRHRVCFWARPAALERSPGPGRNSELLAGLLSLAWTVCHGARRAFQPSIPAGRRLVRRPTGDIYLKSVGWIHRRAPPGTGEALAAFPLAPSLWPLCDLHGLLVPLGAPLSWWVRDLLPPFLLFVNLRQAWGDLTDAFRVLVSR